jgi:hypothetical protein
VDAAGRRFFSPVITTAWLSRLFLSIIRLQ